MELQEFIKNSLVDIRTGVRMANDELQTKGEKQRVFELDTYSKEGGHVIFDVAVVASHESGKSGSGGIKISVVGIGGGVGGEKSNKAIQESVSRIKFAVKIAWVVA